MARNLVLDRLDNALCGSGTLIVLNGGSSGFLSRTDDLQGREALDVHATTESLVFFFITIDSSDLGNAIERFGSLFVGGLEILTMTTPWSIESESIG
jgi:hypothetical protein